MIKHAPGASSLLQCVAVRFSALQCVAVRCSALQCVAVRCSALRCDAVRCSVLRCDAVPCSVPQDHAELEALDATLAAKHSVVCGKLYIYIHIYTCRIRSLGREVVCKTFRGVWQTTHIYIHIYIYIHLSKILWCVANCI